MRTKFSEANMMSTSPDIPRRHCEQRGTWPDYRLSQCWRWDTIGVREKHVDTAHTLLTTSYTPAVIGISLQWSLRQKPLVFPAWRWSLGPALISPDIQTISGSGAINSQSHLSEIFSLLLIETLLCVVLSLCTWTACLTANRSVVSQACLCSGFLR